MEPNRLFGATGIVILINPAMNPSRERIYAALFLSLAVVVSALALWPELDISRVDLNDNVFHYALVERIVEAVQHGENPLDCWSAEWSLGFPVLRVYQPLAHLLVAGAWFALGKTIPLMSIFVWARFLSVALLPLSFYAAARLLGLARLTAAAAALLAPLVSTDYLYGIEYGSYLWAGSGLFPQAVATHFLLLAVGVGYSAVRHGRRIVLAGVLVGLTLISHLIYGYIAAFTVLLMAFLPDAAPRVVRLGRTLAIGIAAFLVSAFQLLPLLEDGALINHSRWEPVWKWESFGAATVLTRLFTGGLLDHGRLPVLTLLAFAGAALLLWKRRGDTGEAHRFVAAAAAGWILMYFGRPFWGPLLSVLGVSEDMHLHRVIGGAQIFLVLLGAIALSWMWRQLFARRQAAAAVIVTAILLYPMVKERARYLTNNAVWGSRNLSAHASEHDALEATLAKAKERGGRTCAGLAATWGARFKVGDVPFYAFLSTARVPAVAFLYHAMALTGDVMVRFNDFAFAQYRLFNIRTVVAPAGQPMPPFLAPRERFGRFQSYEAPGGGYFDLVDALAAVRTTRRNFYDVNSRWLDTALPAMHTHLLLDWNGGVPDGIGRLDPDAPLPVIASGPPAAGTVVGEEQSGQVYRAAVDATRPVYVLFKMTWHPGWKAYVDGAPHPAAMLSPGFPGVAISGGRHRVEFRYEPGSAKLVLALGGLLLVAILGAWRGLVAAVQGAAMRLASVPRSVATAAGLMLLALPAAMPLFTGQVLWGHDAFCYFPRVVEVHQNVVNGILLPRWAPDLGHGYGQPLFEFHPPFFYLVAELWRLVGFDYVTAVNLACALLVVGSALAMYRLGRLYFGETGGWLAAAAYVYVPYFAVDLYVRSSLEEFAAFPLFPMTLYGFGAFARYGRRRYLVLGSAAYGAVLFCHFPAALLFTPLLLGFLATTAWMARSWRVLAVHAMGFAVGLGLGAASWLPALAEKQYVALNRALAGNAQYTNHFVYLQQLFYSAWGYGFSVPGPNDGMSFAIGWSHLLLAAGACIWIARRPKLADPRLMRYFAAAAVVLCILMLEDAEWLWDHLPLLPYVELPWRLLEPVAVCAAMLVAALGPAIATLPRLRGAAVAAAIALLVAPNLAHLAPGRTTDIDPAAWTPRQLAIRGFETTTMGEITPRWMAAVPPYNPVAASVVSGDAQVRETVRTPFAWSGDVAAKAPSRLQMAIAYYPGWTARVDGRPVEVAPSAGGLIGLDVPPGEHQVAVSWGRSGARRLGEAISLLALAALAIGVRWLRPAACAA
jgi:uncharacterized membrane protein